VLIVATVVGFGLVSVPAQAQQEVSAKRTVPVDSAPAVTASVKPAPAPAAKIVAARTKSAPLADSKPPLPKIRMRVIAPAPRGPWLLQIQNDGPEPLRIPADLRLLRLEVWSPLKNGGGWTKRSKICDGPKDFGLTRTYPHRRALLLEPGMSWIEEFDPRFICFGKQAALLEPQARVRPTFGFVPRSTKRLKRAEKAPFVVDGTLGPRDLRRIKRLVGPTMLLSHSALELDATTTTGRFMASKELASTAHERDNQDASPGHAHPHPHASQGEGDKGSGATTTAAPSAQPIDELAAALTLTTSRYADAAAARDIAVSVEAHNTGGRPVMVALRARQLAFLVEGPDGTVKCPRGSRDHRVPRDLFRTLDDGKHIHMYVLVAEACPPNTFNRPGMYIVTPTLYADASGRELGLDALTGKITTREPGDVGGTHTRDDDASLVRLRFAPRPYYKPAAKPTVAITNNLPLPR